jgi:hypothetical protein
MVWETNKAKTGYSNKVEKFSKQDVVYVYYNNSNQGKP